MREWMELNDHLKRHAPAEGAFDWVLDLQGKVYREVKHRRTLEVELGGRRYFVKVHRGCGWGEVLKDLLQARAPIVSARNEWEAIERLGRLGIATMTLAGYGLRGWSPASRDSFVVTEALEGMISLEDLVKDWGGLSGRGRIRLQEALVVRLAQLARRMHDGGMNHRDFYLCHFLVKDRDWRLWREGDALELHLIDLHRVQLRSRVPRRWVIKDLASLLCSAFEWGVRRRDLVLFVRAYAGKDWGGMNRSGRGFWRMVWRRAWYLFKGFYRRLPPRL